jgi:hypothetical protein
LEANVDRRQELALAKLIGAMEGVVEFGRFSPETEFVFREILAEALAAFDLPSKAELISIPPVLQ